MCNKQLNTSHVYAGNPLDRGNRERRDEEWIAERERGDEQREGLNKTINFVQ